MEIRDLKKDEVYTYDLETNEVAILPMLGIEIDGSKLYKFRNNIYSIKDGKDRSNFAFWFSFSGNKTPYVYQLKFEYALSSERKTDEIPFFFSKKNLLDFISFLSNEMPFYKCGEKECYAIQFGLTNGICITRKKLKTIHPNRAFAYETLDTAKEAFEYVIDGLKRVYKNQINNIEAELKRSADFLDTTIRCGNIVTSFKKGETYIIVERNKKVYSFTVEDIFDGGVVKLTNGRYYVPNCHDRENDVLIVRMDDNSYKTKDMLISLFETYFTTKCHIDYLNSLLGSLNRNLKNIKNGNFNVNSLKDVHQLLTNFGKNIK